MEYSNISRRRYTLPDVWDNENNCLCKNNALTSCASQMPISSSTIPIGAFHQMYGPHFGYFLPFHYNQPIYCYRRFNNTCKCCHARYNILFYNCYSCYFKIVYVV